MGISHKWNGTVLTITSDSGTSSCDLKGEKGDMGVRGAQGIAGVLVDTTGYMIADASNYYTKDEVNAVTNNIMLLTPKMISHLIANAPPLKTIKGVRTIDKPSVSTIGSFTDIKFKSNGKTYSSLRVEYVGDEYGSGYIIYYDNQLVTYADTVGMNFDFIDAAFATIDFGTSNQEITSNELSFLNAIAPMPNITFYIDGSMYEMSGGSIWADFSIDDGVSGIYCSNGYLIYDAYGSVGVQWYIVDESGNKQKSTDEIRNGGIYSQGDMV